MYKLKLKVLWVENILGFGVDQLTIKQQSPVTLYYFWPRTEAWEQLKSELDSKLWLSKEEKVINPYFGEAMLTCGEVKQVIE